MNLAMSFITYDQVRGYQSRSSKSGDRIIIEASTHSDNKDVFLSHSSLDNSLLPGAIALLEEHGASVYVDKGDDALPNPPSTHTASVLRRRIAESRRFIVLVTANSNQSRWIPWELGIADGLNGVAPVATFPMMANSTSSSAWARQEYFGLYPRIFYQESRSRFEVLDPRDGKSWSLQSWITGGVQ